MSFPLSISCKTRTSILKHWIFVFKRSLVCFLFIIFTVLRFSLIIWKNFNICPFLIEFFWLLSIWSEWSLRLTYHWGNIYFKFEFSSLFSFRKLCRYYHAHPNVKYYPGNLWIKLMPKWWKILLSTVFWSHFYHN